MNELTIAYVVIGVIIGKIVFEILAFFVRQIAYFISRFYRDIIK